jgi:hypothetical protein
MSLIPSKTDIKVTTSPRKDQPFLLAAAFEIIPESKIQNQKKKFGTHFGPLFEEKRLPSYNNCSNHVYVKFYCASSGKIIIFYFCTYIELCLIKG